MNRITIYVQSDHLVMLVDEKSILTGKNIFWMGTQQTWQTFIKWFATFPAGYWQELKIKN